MLGDSRTKRHRGERRIRTATCGKHGAAANEQISDTVYTTVAVHHALIRIIVHSGGAHVMKHVRDDTLPPGDIVCWRQDKLDSPESKPPKFIRQRLSKSQDRFPTC